MKEEKPSASTVSPVNESLPKKELKALVVVYITLGTMAAEIVFGLITGSMALLADGIHMGTHAIALGVTVGAYALARRWSRHPGFSFGTGKIGVLGGYTNAILLGSTAIFMVIEAVGRLVSPEAIDHDMALWVAVLGLGVNLVSAFILQDHHHDHPQHDHDHDHPARQDSNLRAALAHVMADALTSVLAISALIAAKLWGWNWLDPAVALLGAALILLWAWGLLKDTGALLLDFGNYGPQAEAIHEKIDEAGGRVKNLRIWRSGEESISLLLSVSPAPQMETSRAVRERLGPLMQVYSHTNIEVSDES